MTDVSPAAQQQQPDSQMVPIADIERAKEYQEQLRKFIKENMRDGVDHGIIPGTPKRSLLQPGAQKLLFYHGLGVYITSVRDETMIDWKEPFFNYTYKAQAIHNKSGRVVAECIGSANSKESRYRFLWLYESQLSQDQKAIMDELTKKMYGNTPKYRIEKPKEELFGLPNTLQKMAQKRAVVGVAILATRASAEFVDEDDAEKEKTKAKEAATGGGKDAPMSPKQAGFLKGSAEKAGIKNDELLSYIYNKFPYTIDEEKGGVVFANLKKGDVDSVLNWIKNRKS